MIFRCIDVFNIINLKKRARKACKSTQMQANVMEEIRTRSVPAIVLTA